MLPPPFFLQKNNNKKDFFGMLIFAFCFALLFCFKTQFPQCLFPPEAFLFLFIFSFYLPTKMGLQLPMLSTWITCRYL